MADQTVRDGAEFLLAWLLTGRSPGRFLEHGGSGADSLAPVLRRAGWTPGDSAASVELLVVGPQADAAQVVRALDFGRPGPDFVVLGAGREKAANDALDQMMGRRGLAFARATAGRRFYARRKIDAAALLWKRIDCALDDGRRLLQNDRWLAPNVLCQAPDQPFGTLLDWFPAADGPDPAGLRLAHIVNPFAGPPAHRRVQDATLAAMAAARRYDGGEVRLVAVTSPEDAAEAPEGFIAAPTLTRTVGDLASFSRFRPLPLVFDILEQGLAAAGEVDAFVFTNIDICPMPHLYQVVRDLFGRGFDALTINRRVVVDRGQAVPLPLAYAELGHPHPGFDCFVFSAELWRRFVRNDACVGAGFAMRGLLHNLVAHARRMLMIKNAHLTFHLGDDRGWNTEAFADYQAHNSRQTSELLKRLAAAPEARARLDAFCRNHPEPFRV